MRGICRTWLFCACLALCQGANAHEIGTTQAHLDINEDGTWSARISTGPSALINRLEAETHQPLSRDLSPEAVSAKFGQFTHILARHVSVTFDGKDASPAMSLSRIEMPDDVTRPAFVEFCARGTFPADARTVTWRYDLVSSTYGIVFTDRTGGVSDTQWLEGDTESRPFTLAGQAPAATILHIAGQYLELGFRHILPEGLDHILFVLGLILLTTQPRPILLQVTAFTIAHSVTLGLTMYGILSLPSRVVEPLIALSIAYVAIDNIRSRTLTPWRPAVVFCFGLLHGMGFAGALADLHLARRDVIPALICFNIGIELAQLTIIAMALLAVSFRYCDKSWYRSYCVVPGSLMIAATGLFWTVQRIGGF